MIVETITASKARAFSIQAGLVLLVAVLLSVTNVNLFGYTLSFLFMPLIAVYLWPKEADLFLTYLLIFISGILLDILSGGAIGLWAIIFLLGFMTTRPDQRGPELSLAEWWLNFTMWMLVMVSVFFVLSLVVDDQIALFPLALMLVINIVIFPGFYYARRLVRAYFVEEDYG